MKFDQAKKAIHADLVLANLRYSKLDLTNGIDEPSFKAGLDKACIRCYEQFLTILEFLEIEQNNKIKRLLEFYK